MTTKGDSKLTKSPEIEPRQTSSLVLSIGYSVLYGVRLTSQQGMHSVTTYVTITFYKFEIDIGIIVLNTKILIDKKKIVIV